MVMVMVMVIDGWLHDKIAACWLKKTGKDPTDRGNRVQNAA